MFDAINAGDIYLAPFPAPAGNKPGCGASVAALAIPVGAQNAEAAKDYINWTLTPEQNPAYVLGPGAGFPVLKSIQATEQFQSQFYKEAAEVVAASDCSMPFPTITDVDWCFQGHHERGLQADQAGSDRGHHYRAAKGGG